jgi:hypothetical protein
VTVTEKKQRVAVTEVVGRPLVNPVDDALIVQRASQPLC